MPNPNEEAMPTDANEELAKQLEATGEYRVLRRLVAAWSPPDLDELVSAARSRAAVWIVGARADQAALPSIWVKWLGLAPLMAIRRGFIASGISRCRSIISKPFSNRAPLTSTWSASVN
jgi:hypothetical protein